MAHVYSYRLSLSLSLCHSLRTAHSPKKKAGVLFSQYVRVSKDV